MNKTVTLLLFMIISIVGFSQKSDRKIPLDFSVYDNWQTIGSKAISNDGKWIFYLANPYKGNDILHITSADLKTKKSVIGVQSVKFSPNSDFIVFKKTPDYDTIRNLKLKKVKKEKLPKDSLFIWDFKSDFQKYAKVKSYKLAEKNSSWICFSYKKKKEEKKDTTDKKKEKKKKKSKKVFKSAPKSFDFVILNPISQKKYEYDNVVEFDISKEGDLITFVKFRNDSVFQSKLFLFDTKTQNLDSLTFDDNLIKKITSDEKGKQIAYILTKDTAKRKVYELNYLAVKDKSPQKLIDTLSTSIPENWTVSKNGSIYFSEKGERLYFGIAEKPEIEKKDSLLENEKVKVDIWNWQDGTLMTQQLNNREKDLKKTYLTIYHIKTKDIIRLEKDEIDYIRVADKGNGDVAIAVTNNAYAKSASWDVPTFNDVYLVDVKTGNYKKIIEKEKVRARLSPFGKYIYWYSYTDSLWKSYSVKTGKKYSLNKDLDVLFCDEENDVPALPGPYYLAGWTSDDQSILIYDRYDIWEFDPENKKQPLNVTAGYGRKNQIVFRYQWLDDEQKHIDKKEPAILSAFDKKTKKSGYFSTDWNVKKAPKELIFDDYRFSQLMKAKNTDQVIWRKSSCSNYPDVWTSNLQFKKAKQISRLNPQQEKYIWSKVEMVEWIAFNGKKEEGLLYKPENFDPNKKYPMMVYFYELNSDNLHRHYYPSPSRSIINPTFYASNGYLVFVPNIRYTEGYPGQSAYDYVVSGVMSLIDKPWVNKDKIGIQGQSWGGYQVAHLVTRTNLFAAAEAGAPVSNMTSAYGGIRWGSGMSRMFQYEKTQSRIGKDLWNGLPLYLENSPVFHAPKVETPLMIMHNDNDGAVPWYQGIELFVALRRLGKPAWLLNYNGEPHNLRHNSPNRKDLSIRMMQFFDHYLKDKPAPVWMTEGIPAVKKGKTMGYELDK